MPASEVDAEEDHSRADHLLDTEVFSQEQDAGDDAG
jgi:hypothetical protein